jgi:acetyl-CoA carboxylase carboxyl transferase subunit alpha
MGLIDEIVPEPLGGAHRNPQKMAEDLKEVMKRNLNELKELERERLLKLRYKKFRAMGVVA